MPFPVGLCVYTFFCCSVVLFGGSICIYTFSNRPVYLYLLRLLYCFFRWIYLCLCLLQWVCVSVSSSIALLFFPMGLFMSVSGSVPSITGPLFFLVDLFVLCAFSSRVLFFPLGLSIFIFPFIVSLFLFPVGLFVF